VADYLTRCPLVYKEYIVPSDQQAERRAYSMVTKNKWKWLCPSFSSRMLILWQWLSRAHIIVLFWHKVDLSASPPNHQRNGALEKMNGTTHSLIPTQLQQPPKRFSSFIKPGEHIAPVLLINPLAPIGVAIVVCGVVPVHPKKKVDVVHLCNNSRHTHTHRGATQANRTICSRVVNLLLTYEAVCNKQIGTPAFTTLTNSPQQKSGTQANANKSATFEV